MCKNEFKDNNHFDSRNSTSEIWALEIPESRMSSKRHSDTLCVKHIVKNFKIGKKWPLLSKTETGVISSFYLQGLDSLYLAHLEPPASDKQMLF